MTSSPMSPRMCHECEVGKPSSPPPNRRPVRQCLSCSVSGLFDESSAAEPSLPWTGKANGAVGQAGKEGLPECLLRQSSVQKILHQAERCKRRPKRLVDKHGACNVVQTLKASYAGDFLNDLFTTVVDLRWRLMLLFFSLAYLSGWLGFSGLWYLLAWCHDDLGYLDRNQTDFEPCVANVDSFTAAFLFSVETQTTIGYGFRSVTEVCWVGPALVVIQSIFSALVDAILVGCVFVKIARPKKRAATIKFSREAVVAQRDGQLCLMFRVGDIRTSHIFDTIIRAKLIRPKITAEGECIPLYNHPMDVGQSTGEDSLLLVWPIIVTHVIDEKSPLYHYSKSDLADSSFEIVVYLEGVVEQTGLVTQVRTSYLPAEIKWGHRFSSHIVSMADADRKLRVDYSHFDMTYADSSTPKCSAYDLDNSLPTPDHSPGHFQNGKNTRKRPSRFQLGNDRARDQSTQLSVEDGGETGDLTQYVGITSIKDGYSPPTTPIIKGTNNFNETNI